MGSLWILVPAVAVMAGAALVTAALRQGFNQMASAVYDALKADIESAARELSEKNARIAALEASVADLTAKLQGAIPTLKPALDPVTDPINPPVSA